MRESFKASSREDAFLLENKVPIHEWLAILTLSLLLIFCSFYSYRYAPSALPCCEEVPYVTVYLEGAVVAPGCFTAKRGTSLGGLLQEVRCKEEMSKKGLPLKRALVDQEAIYIPYKKKKNDR
jgi:hypothetical protein